MDGLGRAKQDARAEGNAGAIAEVYRGAHDCKDAGDRVTQDAVTEGDGEIVQRPRNWPGHARERCAVRTSPGPLPDSLSSMMAGREHIPR